MTGLATLLAEVRACRLCEGLPLGPKPIFQIDQRARILIAAQAPGRLAHERGRSFDDPSGNRLRDWMGIDRDTFYDASKIAIMAMGFCFPGSGKGGDLPPRPECAPAWRSKLLAQLPNVGLTLVIGQYSQAWHLPLFARLSVTDRVRGWRDGPAGVMPLPHPSPRNIGWLKRNPWFDEDVVPALKNLVSRHL
jgi:uracil-DNA glycosylase